MASLPRKYIEVEDLIFALPDDFEGNFQDSLRLLLDYILGSKSSSKGPDIVDADNNRGVAMLENAKAGSKVSIKFQLWEYNDETKNYEAKSSIGSSSDNTTKHIE